MLFGKMDLYYVMVSMHEGWNRSRVAFAMMVWVGSSQLATLFQQYFDW